MFNLYAPDQARQTILKRMGIDDQPIPDALQASLENLFGERLTPAEAVNRILNSVRTRGDEAVRDWAKRLDRSEAINFRVPTEEISAALAVLSSVQRTALEESADRVRRFHQHQPAASWVTQDLGGTLGQLLRPIHRVGVYVPAGTAPLPSSVIMSAVPAQVAGVKEIVLVAPPQKDTGKIAPIILATAALLGLDEIYALGGAQAIAALAYGTETIPRVDKIVGPGNLFVTLAKRQVFGVVGIDSLAGPTETVVIADENAQPSWVAADLLAQAEHDVMASAILLTPSKTLAEKVQLEIAHQMESLSRHEIIAVSLERRSGAVITQDLDEAVALSNEYGPEHLCLAVADPWRWAEKITSAGGIFLGEHSFEVLGDYVAGPSHVMPTSGSARFASPLNVWDFLRVISLIGLNPETAAKIGASAAQIAYAEGLDGHAKAAEKRL